MTADLTLDTELPCSIDAEKTLLGAVLLDNSAWEEIRQRGLHSTDFFLDNHRRIAKAMAALLKNGHAVDIITLANELRARKEIDAIGGISFLASLTEDLPRRPVIEEYIRIVRNKSVLRNLMATCSTAMSRAQDPAETGLELTAELMGQLEKLTASSGNVNQAPVQNFIVEALGEINREYAEKLSPCIPTGNAWLDSKMGGGFRHGHITIVAARPKVGKTGMAVSSMAYNLQRGRRVVMFSLEMEKLEILKNLVPYVVDLPNIVVARPWLQTSEQNRLVNEAMNTIVDWPLSVYDGDMDCDEVCWIIDRETRQGEEVLFVLDHFGLMTGAEKDIRKRYVENSDRLRRKMKHKKAALLSLFQLNEVPREYADKRPQPGDIGESKKPLQDCFAMVLLHRYQDKETLKMTKKANINLALIRGGGSSGNVDCNFDTRRLCFDADPELEMDYNE
jgi:replicative DNA helicase